jgi:HD-GYP domain-containing protein (c-di-GMP phosphodiesterase class II)
MLHDIGKLQIDKAILDKPGKLTDEERNEVERHCRLGYDMLIKQVELSATSAHCALQHHEKYDGSGYPQRLRGQEIHEFGRLLAVPDVYDALTSNRVYRKAFLPHEAMEFLYSNVGNHFDKQWVDLFIHHVNIYPNGLTVQLSNGAKGVVARSNEGNLQRPVILVLEEEGAPVTPHELNLAEQLNVVITGCDVL